jgi:hypothetical protein
MLSQILENIKNFKKDNTKKVPHNFYNNTIYKKPDAYKSINSSSLLIKPTVIISNNVEKNN